MADEQVPFRVQAMIELFDQTFLLGLIEINHDVPAENNVVTPRQEVRLQIVKIKLDEALQRRFHDILVGEPVEIA